MIAVPIEGQAMQEGRRWRFLGIHDLDCLVRFTVKLTSNTF
jgi:hypothetical protein